MLTSSQEDDIPAMREVSHSASYFKAKDNMLSFRVVNFLLSIRSCSEHPYSFLDYSAPDTDGTKYHKDNEPSVMFSLDLWYAWGAHQVCLLTLSSSTTDILSTASGRYSTLTFSCRQRRVLNHDLSTKSSCTYLFRSFFFIPMERSPPRRS